MFGKMLPREVKEKLYKKIRKKITKKKSTIMIQTRTKPGSDDAILVLMSPNILDKSEELPKVFENFDVFYQELEPFKFHKEIDRVL